MRIRQGEAMPRMGAAEVATALRRAIDEGAYGRMERLPASRRLSEEYGVARNTLREALGRLEREGLVQTRPGSGTYVTPARAPAPTALEEAAPLELMDARFALEPHICRLCVLHARREDFEAMEALCRRMEGAVADPAAFAEADAAFHRALAEATRGRLLIWLVDQINGVRSMEEWTRMLRLTLDAAMIGRYNAQHRAILHALRAREPEQAAAAMREHLETARTSLTRAAAA